MKQNKLKGGVRLAVFLSAILMVLVLFFPMWQIQLTAPQYPEGLTLKIYPGRLGGDVEIINGLNHYIGMKTLHTEDFLEFTLLPYCMIFFALILMITAIRNRKAFLYFTTALFLIFCIIAMIDFWKWEYNYGHNLDPDAPIQVPGMSYQPPLLGYKQLLNFSAFSIPDAGGWIFITVAVLLGLSAFVEFFDSRKLHRKNFSKAITTMIFSSAFLVSCTTSPEKIQLGKDACSYCKMIISDPHFGGEIITEKGRVYKFDDLFCLTSFLKQNDMPRKVQASVYSVNYSGDHKLLKADEHLLLYKTEQLHSPMNGNIAAFDNKDSLAVVMDKFPGGLPLNWEELIK